MWLHPGLRGERRRGREREGSGHRAGFRCHKTLHCFRTLISEHIIIVIIVIIATFPFLTARERGEW